MPDRTITNATGSTVTRTQNDDGDTVIVLDHPNAPADLRNTEAGRVIDGGFQPAPFAPWAMGATTLRAIAELIEETDRT